MHAWGGLCPQYLGYGMLGSALVCAHACKCVCVCVCVCVCLCPAVPILKYRAGKRFNEDGTLKADEPTPAQDAEEGLKDEAALKEGADKVPSETTESQDSYQNLPKWKQYMKKVSKQAKSMHGA